MNDNLSLTNLPVSESTQKENDLKFIRNFNLTNFQLKTRENSKNYDEINRKYIIPISVFFC